MSSSTCIAHVFTTITGSTLLVEIEKREKRGKRTHTTTKKAEKKNE
jgi:hypothetical protein|tara:strand:+ start:1557 stop:1694 length:138 start_codon:yes stop_codon:yes gene_type:complete